MPIVVHITDAKNIPAIQRVGIRPAGAQKVIYLMPVTQNHLVSHQWLRELKRSGARRLVGVYVRLESSEPVWAGRYNEAHAQVTLGQAIRMLNERDDPLGFEMFLCRKIAASEIQRVRELPQVIGWRYMPHVHGRTPCACPACLPRGAIKSRALRERLEPIPVMPSLQTVRAQIAAAVAVDDLAETLWPLRTKRRRIDPSFLERVLELGDAYLLEELAQTLPYIRHPRSIEMLRTLEANANADVSKAATEALTGLGLPLPTRMAEQSSR